MSRLNQMQARFQQRQLEEKEQKLVMMYENAQAQALKRVGGAATTAPQNPGKVRQMFEERRTRVGIDKGHPLQPLGGGPPQAPARAQRGEGHTYRMTSVQGDGVTNIRKEVILEIKQKSSPNNDLPVSKNHRFESERVFKDINLNDESLDDVTFPDTITLDQLTLESVSTKLPNVGGSLPSQRQPKQENNNPVTRNGVKKASDGVRMNGDAKEKVAPVERRRATPPKTLRTQAAPVAVKPRVNSTASSPSITNAPTPVKARTPVERQHTPTPAKTTSAPSPRRMANKTTLPLGNNDGTRCRICNRPFAEERLAKHQEICAKAAAKKRKPYDTVKHRIAGTEVEPYVRVVKKGGKIQATPKSGPINLKPNNWRKKHEEFINAIRAAKQVQAHIKKGGKLSDLPPPPPSDTSDYVMCPHCNRRFNESAAERHIPKCATFQFNKKPQPAKKR